MPIDLSSSIYACIIMCIHMHVCTQTDTHILNFVTKILPYTDCERWLSSLGKTVVFASDAAETKSIMQAMGKKRRMQS